MAAAMWPPDDPPSPDRIVPVPDPVSEPFWAAARDGRLVVQRCSRCRLMQHPPRAWCTSCSAVPEYEQVSGRATLVSWTTVDARAGTERAPEPTSLVVVVELVEQPGLWFVSDLDWVPSDPATLQIGRPMRVVFDARADEMVLPRFTVSEENL